MRRTYRLADCTVGITPLHAAFHAFCADYAVDAAEADFEVEISPADIAFERARALQPGCSDAYLETLAVCRRIAEAMPGHGALLFHASAVAVDGQAYLFTAKSGTGKSTHARLWREMLGPRAVMVNDDKPLLRLPAAGGALVCGSPWDGKHHLSSNISVPIRAICILDRAKENRIRRVSPPEALPALLRQAYRPMDPAALQKTLSLLDRLAAGVALYHLECNMDPSAAECSYQAMKG